MYTLFHLSDGFTAIWRQVYPMLFDVRWVQCYLTSDGFNAIWRQMDSMLFDVRWIQFYLTSDGFNVILRQMDSMLFYVRWINSIKVEGEFRFTDLNFKVFKVACLCGSFQLKYLAFFKGSESNLFSSRFSDFHTSKLRIHPAKSQGLCHVISKDRADNCPLIDSCRIIMTLWWGKKWAVRVALIWNADYTHVRQPRPAII